MAWGGTSNPQRFERAIQALAEKAVLTREEWDHLAATASERGFTISGVAQLDVIAEVHAETVTAVAEGEDFLTWKERVQGELDNAWQGTVAKPGHRLETIYRNALQSSYNSGRHYQQTRPSIATARPYWIYDSVLDDRTTIVCQERNGITLHMDDAFWDHAYPPSHHRCRAGVRTTTAAGAARRAGDAPSPADATTPIPEGWGRTASEAKWQPDPDDYPPELWRAYQATRADAGQVPGRITRALDETIGGGP